MTLTLAEQLRDEAIERTAHKHDLWCASVVSWIRLRDPGFEFTTDELWRTFPQPSEPRAMGAAIKAARVAQLIEPHGYRKSRRPECHARPVAVWRRT